MNQPSVTGLVVQNLCVNVCVNIRRILLFQLSSPCEVKCAEKCQFFSQIPEQRINKTQINKQQHQQKGQVVRMEQRKKKELIN